MFPRSRRLSKEEILKLTKTGKPINTSLFSLKLSVTEAKVPKFAFVMSKKEEKTAVGRNKAKRRLRAAMKKLSFSIKPLYCIVFIKKAVLKAPFDDIMSELKKGLSSFITS